MAESDGHSRSGGSGAPPGDSRTTPAPGSAASKSIAAAATGRAVEASQALGASDAGGSAARGTPVRLIPRRPRVTWWIGLLLALGFAIVVTPALTAERWLPAFGARPVQVGEPASVTVRVPPFAGVQAHGRQVAGGGVIVARGEVATEAQVEAVRVLATARPGGRSSYVAFFVLAFVFAALFTHHMQRSTRGRLLRVQLVSLVTIAALAIAVKALMLTTALSILVVPVALLALVPTLALDRVVGIATGVLAALIASLLVPFDVTVAILLLVQAAAAGLVVPERPRLPGKAALGAGLVATLLTVATLLLIGFLTRNAWPSLDAPLGAPWLAAVIGPAIAMVLAVPLLPPYQLLVGEITHGKLVELEDLSNPLLRQISERSPGTWQHSLMMANMAEIAANAIGASGRLVRVGAYYHDLGKSLTPKYFIENLQPGETSPHDQLPPEVSCAAIFQHVTEGVAAARRAGLHERIIDFMHMHHGDGVLEYFWSKTQEQGNPRSLGIEQFRYPGHPPQSRETAILAIVDAVEAASRTLKRPDPAAIDALVQRIVYGKLDLGQLDESGLSMADLRRISASLRDTIRHANHGRIEYPWQRAQREAGTAPAATVVASPAVTATASTASQPRLDSLDRRPQRETAVHAAVRPPADLVEDGEAAAAADTRGREAARRMVVTTPGADEDLGILETAPLTPPARERSSEVPGSGPGSAPGSAQTPSQAHLQAEAIERALDEAEAPAPAHAAAEAARRPVGESTQVGLAPAPAPALVLDPRRTPPVEPAAGGTQLGLAASPAGRAAPHAAPHARTGSDGGRPRTPPPPPGARPAPGIHDDLDTPAMPAMLGERVRAESRAGFEPPALAPSTLPGHRVPATRQPAMSGDAAQPRAGADDDPGATAPLLQRFEPPDRERRTAAPPAAAGADAGAEHPWSSGLASRIDAALDDEHDAWVKETPVAPPTMAELRALLGTPDPTRQQSLDELEALHRATDELPSEPELLAPPPRRAPYTTTEVDPDQIEAAIELAPPARRANTVSAIQRPKKRE